MAGWLGGLLGLVFEEKKGGWASVEGSRGAGLLVAGKIRRGIVQK